MFWSWDQIRFDKIIEVKIKIYDEDDKRSVIIIS